MSDAGKGAFAEMLGRTLYPNHKYGQFVLSTGAAYDWTHSIHGATPEGVLWTGLDNQRDRFKTLVKIFDEDDRKNGASVNDLGCAYGAFFAFLSKKPVMRNGRFFGYDVSPKMLTEAKTRFAGDERATFYLSSCVTEKCDYSFASGTFGLKMKAEQERWGDYVKDCLRNMAVHSVKGLAFNVLDHRSKVKKADLYYADPEEYLDFCKAEFGGTISFYDDYNPIDWTILVRF